jgi:hypothetical protein
VDQFLGQHRFQLSLLTRTVHDVLDGAAAAPEAERATGPDAPRGGPELSARATLLDALDYFKTNRCVSADVRGRDGRRRRLARTALMSGIDDAFSAAGEEATST